MNTGAPFEGEWDGDVIIAPCASTRVRAWCFTMFPETREQGQEAMDHLISTYQPMRFYAGFEICPSTGNLHIQGYIRMHNPMFPRPLARIIKKGRIAAARGGDVANRKYCLKDRDVIYDVTEGPLTHDERLEVERKRFDKCIEELKNKTMMQFIEANSAMWFKYSGSIMKLKEMIERTNMTPWGGDLKSKNFWVGGEPGVGKTRWAHSIDPEHTLRKNQNKWWSGWNNSVKVIVIDDWDPNTKGINSYLKQWADRYPFTAEIKGGSEVINPGSYILVVTSNYPMNACFEGEDLTALRRRFTEWFIRDPSDMRLQGVPDVTELMT